MKIEYLELVFENCDSIKIKFNPKEMVIHLSEINKEFFSLYLGETYENRVAHTAKIMLPHSISVLKTKWNENFLDKLYRSDITHVYLYFKNGKQKYYSVIWDDKYIYKNNFQTIKITDEFVKIEIKRS